MPLGAAGRLHENGCPSGTAGRALGGKGVGDRGATFSSLAEARAAFALGPVRYRCLACGRAHRSDAKEGRECLRLLAEKYGWKAHGEPTPPWPQCTPAFLFVQCLWAQRYAGLAFAASASRPLPRELLALDPGADVRGELRRCREEFAEESRRRADEAWSAWRAIAEWRRELAGLRPPADAEVAAHSPVSGGQRLIWSYLVRPRARCAGATAAIEVRGNVLYEAIPQKKAADRAAPELVHVEYRPEYFLVVFQMVARTWDHRVVGFMVYREKYGARGVSTFVALPPGADPGRFLQELLSKG